MYKVNTSVYMMQQTPGIPCYKDPAGIQLDLATEVLQVLEFCKH